jgi:beta-lactamase superfamily II metal-dependent hydrolase
MTDIQDAPPSLAAPATSPAAPATQTPSPIVEAALPVGAPSAADGAQDGEPTDSETIVVVVELSADTTGGNAVQPATLPSSKSATESLPSGVGVVPPSKLPVEPPIDAADKVVEISIVHGGFENAEYPLIVGSFEGEHLSSAERFLDRQFGGQLASRVEINRYPTAIGESLFLHASPDQPVPSEPPGAYIVGLGPSSKLGRGELAISVSHALVDRCVELYPNPLAGDSDAHVIEVGVSSTLLGVRHGETLRVEDSVVGIVEGVISANEALTRFEAAQPDRHVKVRITALQFIERYADRCDLAAASLRSLATSIALDTRYDALSRTVVDVRSGGRPAGAELVESAQRFRRFLITKRPDDTVAPDPRVLHLDVAVMGGAARSDRVQHRLDRVMVDALLAKLIEDSSDAQTAATLYDQLVPHELREQFLTSASVHFVVDSTTANYPWELVTVPRPTGHASITAAGGIVRQFSETEVRGWGSRTATRGGVLILGAANVPNYPTLDGVHAEVATVTDKVRQMFPDDTAILADDERPLDLVDVQNQLFTEHRILHIASHGIYRDGHPEETGAVLSETGLLTVDTVRQLRTVPELVFLNCCSLGRIGDSRLAAGLAREFMAAGARAVIAAGWKVNDLAAQAFASSFYGEFLSGHSFGDSVAKARLMCAKADDSRTWAAYQCYGDPAFVLRGAGGEGGLNYSEPVSESDLIARLQALATRISDYGRPGLTGGAGLRRRLLKAWDQLEGWASRQPALSQHATVDRLLTTTLRDLGELDRAASRYLRNVSFDTRLGSRAVGIAETITPADVRDAADCLARCSQAQARSSQTDDVVRFAAAMTGFDRAERLARTAVDLVDNDVTRGVVGDVLLRRATVDTERRSDLLAEAMRVYQKRDGGASSDYRLEDVAQLASIGRPSASSLRSGRVAERVRVAREAEALLAGRDEPPRRVDQRAGASSTFESRVRLGDGALTIFLERGPEVGLATRAGEVLHRYEAAFCARSTWSQRRRTVEHLVDLRDLLAVEDSRRAPLEEIIASLLSWETVNVEDDDVTSATTVSDCVDGVESAERSGTTGTLSVTVFPAARGDCLLIDYTTSSEVEYRVLVDGGLGAAFAEGLGAHIASLPNKRLDVDTAIVTHIDLDHIEGILCGLRSGELTIDDVWFNGLGEMAATDRGPRQGDELSMLVPKHLRNQCVGGQAIVVPDKGPMLTLTLDGGARCTVLGPTRQRLKALAAKWKSPARGDGNPDPILALCDRLGDDANVEDRGAGSFGGDRSVANGSSLAVLFEYGNVSLLLTGDAFASDLEASIRRLLTERRQTKLVVDVFKLSHHGSRGNLTTSLLALIEPAKILVCTDGSMFKHPDADALGEVRRCYPNVPIVFSDNTELIVERASAVDGIVPTSTPLRLLF